MAAAIFHFVSLAETLNAAHHRLPVETHEVQSLLALILAVAFLLVYARYRSVSIGIFVLPIAFMFAMLAAFRPGQETFSAPIRTGWISPAYCAVAGRLRRAGGLAAGLVALPDSGAAIEVEVDATAGCRRWTRRWRPSIRSP